MSPNHVSTEIQSFSVPRASGDEPPGDSHLYLLNPCSPRERG